MRNFFKTTFITAFLTTFLCITAFAQSNTPVKIAFDDNSKRIDLITGKATPDYKSAQRGSFQFFLYKLDKPNDYFEFYHDGVRQAKLETLRSMEKVQPQFAIWRLNYKNGGKNTPRIHHLAVSFVPLNDQNKPERRVYFLLNDLKLIDNGTDK